ncbi:glycoside hydrolase [bacterium]|nr:glycoside hydrolase [bacterium]
MSCTRNNAFSPAVTVLIIALIAGCGSPGGPGPADFPDLLTADSNPETCGDAWPLSLFYDRGAWFGFGLPDSANVPAGSFSGPFFHFSGSWAGGALIGLQVRNGETGDSFDFTRARNTRSYLPGRLVQNSLFPDLEATLTLIYISGRSALITADVTSLSGHHLSLDISWCGTAAAPLGTEGNLIVLSPPADGIDARITAAGNGRPVLSRDGRSYTLPADSGRHLSTAGRTRTCAAFTITYPGDERSAEARLVQEALQAPENFLKANQSRWSAYLAPAPSGREGIVYVKSVMTLIANWRHARGDLLHDGLLPSAAVGYFNGFWAWDSWKHAAALAAIAPGLAKDQVRAMFDYQDADGMIADCIYADQAENNVRNSKPPLAGWAVHTIFRTTADTAFVREMLPGLKRYHAWWYAFRDCDGDGLCEYGSSDGTLIAARWESGMDDGVRFDNTRMRKNSDAAWSMDQASVDLNSYLFLEKKCLADLCRASGDNHAAEEYEKEAEGLADAVRERMYDPATGFFYDVQLNGGGYIPVKGPEGWIPLWTGIADSAQAAAVRAAMLDTAQFATHVPLPTVPADHPEFMTGYWRGPVWLDQAWFGIEGLHRYGYGRDADMLKQGLLNNAAGVSVPGAALRENYDPRDGSGLKVHHFSWSAAHLLMLTGH